MSTYTISPKSSIESLRSAASDMSSPDRLAPALTGPMVWKMEELDAARYVIELTPREVQDIRAAVIKVKSILTDPGQLPELTMASCWHPKIRNQERDV
jgi:hypothetical protein